MARQCIYCGAELKRNRPEVRCCSRPECKRKDARARLEQAAEAAGRPPPRKLRPPGTCSVQVCDAPSKSQGLCNNHYARHREGRPLLGYIRAPSARYCLSCRQPIRANSGGLYCMRTPCRTAYERARSVKRIRPERLTAPIAQLDSVLPPLGVLVADDDGSRVQCHACGRFFKALSGHVITHAMSPADYREAYGLPRTLSLSAPAVQGRLRDLALKSGLGGRGKANLAALPPTGRPKGSTARLGERIGHSKAMRKKP